MLGRTNAYVHKTVANLDVPASREQIVEGFEAYDNNLEKIIGTYTGAGGDSNTLIAKNDDELQLLLADDANIGKFVQFAGTSSNVGYIQNQTYKIIGRGEAEHFEVGDALTKMYFDSTKTLDVEAIKANCPSGLYDDFIPYWVLIDAGHIEDSILFLEYTAEMMDDIEGLDGTESFSFIATTSEFRAQLWYSEDMASMSDGSMQPGWQMKSYIPTKGLVVVGVQGQEVWGEYITKIPGGNFAEPYYPLLELDHPASVSEIASGKALYDAQGNTIVGEAMILPASYIHGSSGDDGYPDRGLGSFEIVLNSPITRIRNNCFAYANNPRVKIGTADIDSIHPEAFRDCGIGHRTYDFRKCTGFKSVGAGAFRENENINVFFPTILGNASFWGSGYDNSFALCHDSSFYFVNDTPFAIGSFDEWFVSRRNKIFVPYNSINAYKTATSWAAIAESIYGWLPENTLNVGDELPTTDSEGRTLVWYDEKSMKEWHIITDIKYDNKIHYCSVV